MDWRRMRIAAAAIMHDMKVWSLSPPARHHDVMRFMHENGVDDPGRGEQGFLTNTGDFVRRKPALMIAENAGQLEGRTKTSPADTLFSEDLW